MVSHSKNSGFSFVELMVTIGILTVIMSVIVYNQSFYSERISLTNDADQMSLIIAQAQAYSISVRETAVGSNDFNSSYGVSFKMETIGCCVVPTLSYLYFKDLNGDGIYNGDTSCPIGGLSECLEKVYLKSGNSIKSICAEIYGLFGQVCNIGQIEITFSRPNTEPRVVVYDLTGIQIASVTGKAFYKAKINLESPNSFKRTVNLIKTGSVSVE